MVDRLGWWPAHSKPGHPQLLFVVSHTRQWRGLSGKGLAVPVLIAPVLTTRAEQKLSAQMMGMDKERYSKEMHRYLDITVRLNWLKAVRQTGLSF